MTAKSIENNCRKEAEQARILTASKDPDNVAEETFYYCLVKNQKNVKQYSWNGKALSPSIKAYIGGIQHFFAKNIASQKVKEVEKKSSSKVVYEISKEAKELRGDTFFYTFTFSPYPFMTNIDTSQNEIDIVVNPDNQKINSVKFGKAVER